MVDQYRQVVGETTLRGIPLVVTCRSKLVRQSIIEKITRCEADLIPLITPFEGKPIVDWGFLISLVTDESKSDQYDAACQVLRGFGVLCRGYDGGFSVTRDNVTVTPTEYRPFSGSYLYFCDRDDAERYARARFSDGKFDIFPFKER